VTASRAIVQAGRFLMNTYKRPPVVFTRGKGCYVYDHRGRRYLDFLGGIAVNALGHAHPRLVRAAARQATRGFHFSNLYHNEFQGPLAAKLAEWSGMDRAFFTNSGSEAVETALKLARAWSRQKSAAPPATRILALEHSFHGRTAGALAATWPEKYRAPFAPLLPGVEFVAFDDVADLERKFDASVCAVILETIQGEGGIRPVSEAFYSRARQLCSAADVPLIADEIQCGLGRTGRRFAYQAFAEPPDIVCVAKPLAGGLPLGAVLARNRFAAAFTPGLHGSTFGGGPLACAVALEFLRTVEEEDLVANAAERGAELRSELERLAAKFSFIREVRGAGLMLGVELATDGAPYVEAAFRRGLLLNCTQERTLRLLPPLNVSARHVREFLAKFETVLARTRPKPRPQSPNSIRKSPSADLKSQAARAAAR
jgi:acetylornithine aminotransferase/acetylornithine/N-succinyldiaminopimelate aminotransferase